MAMSDKKSEIIRVPVVDHAMCPPKSAEELEAEEEAFDKAYKRGLVLPAEKYQGHVFLLVGGMGAGKSTAIRSIMYDYFKRGVLQRGVAFCPTKITGDYDFLPDKWVIEDFDDKKLERYLKYLVLERKRIKDKYGEHAELPRSFLLLDDTFGSVKFYTPTINKVLAQHRHLNMWVFITTQYLSGHGSSTQLRSWANCVFIWHNSNGNSVDSAYYAFGRYLKDEKGQKLIDHVDDFAAITNRAKEEAHRCLLIQVPIGKNPTLNYWKAKPPGPFKVVETHARQTA